MKALFGGVELMGSILCWVGLCEVYGDGWLWLVEDDWSDLIWIGMLMLMRG